MFCPKCATQNMEGARFCRSCGADISLVPQAMAGLAAEKRAAVYAADAKPYQLSKYLEHKSLRSFDNGLRSVFMGLGFLVAAIVLAYQHMGRGWWFWLLIPASTMLGGGVVEILRSRRATNMAALPTASGPAGAMPPQFARPGEFPSRQTGELMAQPPSVTEGTTRHLGAEAPTRHSGTHAENSGKDIS
jgi:hypothetical protein